MSHSKGPLRISGPSQGGPCDDGGDYAIVEPGGIIVGEALRRVGEDAYRDAEANARLWAAAPDLLAALERVRDAAQAPQNRGAMTQLQTCELLDGLLAMIGDALAGTQGAENE